jgi:alpha-tubulin suppressor-like RCC1 family protein
VKGIDNAVAVAATGSATFALLADGSIHAWGWNRMSGNTFGILGIGTDDEETNVPRPVAGISKAVGIAAGSAGTGAAVLADGTVRGWGFGYGPSPGRGLPASNTPLPIDGIQNAVAISPHLALLRDGTVREFGAREWPWDTPKLSNVVAVASDHVNRIALLADGRLMAWGYKRWYPNGAVVRAELGAETARQCAARGLRES